jgi:hypothetical protein
MPFGSVNYLAVLVATVFNMVLGTLWYGPLFGRPWMAVMERIGKKREDMQGSPFIYLGSAVLAFLAALTLAMLIKATGTNTVGMGILWGVVTWIGFGAVPQLNSGIFEDRPVRLWVIFCGYYLVVHIAQGALFVLWP